MKQFILYIIASTLIFYGCSKEDNEPAFKSVFSSSTDGFKVTFTNFSRGATSYHWDFGDGLGAKSTLKSPQHIYKAKGQFIVSLTAKNGELESTFTDTVVIVGPNIKIDNDFSDWDYVDFTVENPEGSNTIKGIKTFANSTDLFFMLEGTEEMNLSPIVMYFDTDNNIQTGYNAWQFGGGSGADYKLEGSVAGGWGALTKHTGVMADGWGGFNTTVADFLMAANFSQFKNTGDGRRRVEFSMKRSLFQNLSGSIKFGFVENNSGYAVIGSIPAVSGTTAFGTFPL